MGSAGADTVTEWSALKQRESVNEEDENELRERKGRGERSYLHHPQTNTRPPDPQFSKLSTSRDGAKDRH